MHIQEFGIHFEWMICDHSEASQSPNPDTRIQIDLDVYHPLMSECPFLRIFSQHLNGKLLKVLFGLHPKESTWGPPPTSSMHERQGVADDVWLKLCLDAVEQQ